MDTVTEPENYVGPELRLCVEILTAFNTVDNQQTSTSRLRAVMELKKRYHEHESGLLLHGLSYMVRFPSPYKKTLTLMDVDNLIMVDIQNFSKDLVGLYLVFIFFHFYCTVEGLSQSRCYQGFHYFCCTQGQHFFLANGYVNRHSTSDQVHYQRWTVQLTWGDEFPAALKMRIETWSLCLRFFCFDSLLHSTKIFSPVFAHKVLSP